MGLKAQANCYSLEVRVVTFCSASSFQDPELHHLMGMVIKAAFDFPNPSLCDSMKSNKAPLHSGFLSHLSQEIVISGMSFMVYVMPCCPCSRRYWCDWNLPWGSRPVNEDLSSSLEKASPCSSWSGDTPDQDNRHPIDTVTQNSQFVHHPSPRKTPCLSAALLNKGHLSSHIPALSILKSSANKSAEILQSCKLLHSFNIIPTRSKFCYSTRIHHISFPCYMCYYIGTSHRHAWRFLRRCLGGEKIYFGISYGVLKVSHHINNKLRKIFSKFFEINRILTG